MNYRGVEYTLKTIEGGVWKYQFAIGRAVKTGRIRTANDASARQRVERRIDRELWIVELEGKD